MLAPRLHDNTTHLFSLVRRWWQHLITTNISSHATNVIRSMLDRLQIYQVMLLVATFSNYFIYYSY
ncbi:hypothetical protein Lalb_Chr25g0281031 [Lupinus albus]|uniref:Uncharacterized protein n=1 Tax=Lupinus albus TaxID=3870 RepID=A0A6A4N3D4_LUPAL|nr:hypothetical protein Lalb_Chr25g0281031 [Lupinus albus]